MRQSLSLLFVLLAAGCQTPADPFDRPATWSLAPAGLGSNDENLRTMVTDPNDLVAGRGTDASNGALAARPVGLLLSGRRAALPAVNASTLDNQGQTGGGAGVGGGGGVGVGQ